jgi:predicted metal-dependent phosphoesterase TrpH
VIDLHTHTDASDGRCAPAELVARAASAGVRVLAVTDHDTVAACAPVAVACTAAGIEFVPGIEVTAVRDEVDVHTLGYFFDVHSAVLADFLSEQRRLRIERVEAMIDRLAAVGIVVDRDAILKPALEDPSKAAGRPWIARALVAAGYVGSIGEAFERWLGRGCPAFVARRAATPEEVIARLHEAGAVTSIAHPGLLRHDEWLPIFAASGLDAIEAYHTDHDEPATSHYLATAERLGVAVSGGSDYHGDAARRGRSLGGVSLPQPAYDRLKALNGRTRRTQ